MAKCKQDGIKYCKNRGYTLQNKPCNTDLRLKLCGKRLYKTKYLRYLGIKFDENLELESPHTCSCLHDLVLFFWIYFFFLTLVFVLQSLSLHWEILIMLLSQFSLIFHYILNRIPHFITLLMTILVLIAAVFKIILEIFHGMISSNSVLLLLLRHFVSEFRLGMMNIFLIKSIRSCLIHLLDFQLLLLLLP